MTLIRLVHLDTRADPSHDPLSTLVGVFVSVCTCTALMLKTTFHGKFNLFFSHYMVLFY